MLETDIRVPGLLGRFASFEVNDIIRKKGREGRNEGSYIKSWGGWGFTKVKKGENLKTLREVNSVKCWRVLIQNGY